jgi:hypothetical protein
MSYSFSVAHVRLSNMLIISNTMSIPTAPAVEVPPARGDFILKKIHMLSQTITLLSMCSLKLSKNVNLSPKVNKKTKITLKKFQ